MLSTANNPFQKIDDAYKNFCQKTLAKKILADKSTPDFACIDLILSCNEHIKKCLYDKQLDMVPRFKAMRALASFVYYTETKLYEHYTTELAEVAEALKPCLDKGIIRNWLQRICLLQYEYFADRTLWLPSPTTKMPFILPPMLIAQWNYSYSLAGINFISERINTAIVLSKEPIIVANSFRFPDALIIDDDL